MLHTLVISFIILMPSLKWNLQWSPSQWNLSVLAWGASTFCHPLLWKTVFCYTPNSSIHPSISHWSTKHERQRLTNLCLLAQRSSILADCTHWLHQGQTIAHLKWCYSCGPSCLSSEVLLERLSPFFFFVKVSIYGCFGGTMGGLSTSNRDPMAHKLGTFNI